MPTPSSDILQRFARIRRDTPDRPLIHLPLLNCVVTAQALWEQGDHQRRLLERAGACAGDLVVYAAGNKPELFGAWIACRLIGAALLAVDAGTTIPELAAIAERLGTDHAILPHTMRAAELGEASPYMPELLHVTPRRSSTARHRYEGAAVLKLTSGSTGLPRATFTTEQQLVEDTTHITTAMDVGPDDCQMAAIPLSHAYGIGNLVVPLLIQGTAIVLRESFVPHLVVSDAAAYRARVFPGVPFMYEHFKNHLSPGAWPRCLDRLISAGARLESSTTRGFHASFGLKIHSFYGTSETGGIAFDDSADLAEAGRVGRPMPGVSITLRPEEGAPVGAGRLLVASSAVSSGYVGEEQPDDGFTAEGFLTGDFGRFDAHGQLILSGRASSFINVAGRKVQPEEVEAVLREMPGIADVRVLGMRDAARGEQIVACIVADGDAPDALKVRRFCAARLAPHKIPRTTITIDRIPLTERGKTDRRSLQQIVDERLRESPGAGVL